MKRTLGFCSAKEAGGTDPRTRMVTTTRSTRKAWNKASRLARNSAARELNVILPWHHCAWASLRPWPGAGSDFVADLDYGSADADSHGRISSDLRASPLPPAPWRGVLRGQAGANRDHPAPGSSGESAFQYHAGTHALRESRRKQLPPLLQPGPSVQCGGCISRRCLDSRN